MATKPAPVLLDFYGRECGVGTICTAAEGKTRQSEVDQADINKILKRFESSGILSSHVKEGFYMDVSEIGDFRDHVDKVAKATVYFEALPAEVRSEFRNDVVVFMEAVANPVNVDRLVELGIYDRESKDAVPEGGADAPPSGAAPK